MTYASVRAGAAGRRRGRDGLSESLSHGIPRQTFCQTSSPSSQGCAFFWPRCRRFFPSAPTLDVFLLCVLNLLFRYLWGSLRFILWLKHNSCQHAASIRKALRHQNTAQCGVPCGHGSPHLPVAVAQRSAPYWSTKQIDTDMKMAIMSRSDSVPFIKGNLLHTVVL